MLKRFLVKNKEAVILLILALLPRIVVFVFIFLKFGEAGFIEGPNGDAGEYATLATNLVKHHAFARGTYPNIVLHTYRPPGYAFFVSIFYFIFKSFWPTIIVQNILSSALVVFIYKVAKKLFNKKAAIAAALLAAFEPNMIFWPNQLVAETLSACFIFGGAWFFVKFIKTLKPRFLLWGSFIWALACYIRPNNKYLFILGFVLSIIFFIKKKKKKLLIFSMLSLIIYVGLLSPWYVRNKIQFDGFFFSGSERVSPNRYINAYKMDKYQNENVEINLADSAAYNNQSLLFKLFIHDPLPFLKYSLLSTIPFFLGDGWLTIKATLFPDSPVPALEWYTGSIKELTGLFKTQFKVAPFLFFGKFLMVFINFFFVWGLIAVFRLKEKKIAITFLVMIILYFALTTGLSSYARFRYPINPIIFIFFGYGLINFSAFFKKIILKLTKKNKFKLIYGI